MTQDDWLHLLARITPLAPWDLDDQGIIPRAGTEARGGHWANADSAPPAGCLWPRLSAGGFIGVWVTRMLADPAFAAARLAAAAIERDVTPIILTSLPLSGFEQYGFRVERLPDGPAETVRAFEDDLTQFWSLAVIVNAEDIAHLG